MTNLTAKKHHILVVDDEPICQMVYSNILINKCQFDVTCANNGHEAITKLNGQFDAILMDVNMPEMDGITTTKEIRKTYPSDQLPIIGVTADDSVQTKNNCLSAGMNHLTIKPINIEKLKNILKIFNLY